MAHTQHIHISGPQLGLGKFIRDLADQARTKIARRRVYDQTLKELNTLSGRDLDDLGICRLNIRSIAYEAAYGPLD